MLFTPVNRSQTGHTLLSSQYILRRLNLDSRKILGVDYGHDDYPEVDGNLNVGEVSPLRTVDNPFGHWTGEEDDLHTYTFKPSAWKSLEEMSYWIQSCVEDNTARNHKLLWELTNTRRYDYREVKRNREGTFPEDFITVAKLQKKKPYRPLTVYNVTAYLESKTRHAAKDVIFAMPSQSKCATGILGGTHNNTALEMGFEEEDGVKDPVKREYDPRYLGFICAGHTAHSSDAGVSRRLTAYSRVRAIYPSILRFLRFIDVKEGETNWIVYCMGATARASKKTVEAIVRRLRDMSVEYARDQFGGRRPGKLLPPATYLVYPKEKILYLSISSGVVVKRLPDGSMVDDAMYRDQVDNRIITHPRMPTEGPNIFEYYFSAFFLFAPFADQNRPPRTLFASGQTTHCITTPWSIGTSRISPVYITDPLVATKFMREVLADRDTNPEAMWDNCPGVSATVCYLNMDLNYEDSMVVSQRFADMGGLSTESICTYRISDKDDVPEVGEKLCRKKYPWWKMECTDTCVCKGLGKYVSAGSRYPSAKVHEVERTEDGAISIKVYSYSPLLTGDKISTMHGQKGVVHLVPHHELPQVFVKRGDEVMPFPVDIFIAVGSIVSRQTNGQVYESAHGLRAADTGEKFTVQPTIDTDTMDTECIRRADTGEVMYRRLVDGTIEKLTATVGITLVMTPTQLTRDRQHLTHQSEGRYSTGTKSGRASGGGVAMAEMDVHAMTSSGLLAPAHEILDRGNMCLIPTCLNCHFLAIICTCGPNSNIVRAKMPYNNIYFDSSSVSLNGTANTYILEHA